MTLEQFVKSYGEYFAKPKTKQIYKLHIPNKNIRDQVAYKLRAKCFNSKKAIEKYILETFGSGMGNYIKIRYSHSETTIKKKKRRNK